MKTNHLSLGRCFIGIFLIFVYAEGHGTFQGTFANPLQGTFVNPLQDAFVNPLQSRRFNLFNFLPLKGEFLKAQISKLLVQVSALETDLTILTAQVAAAAEKCPATALAVGAKQIGTYCYSVNSNAVTFSAALTACHNAGGTLAAPLPTAVASDNLYKALKAAFGSTFTIIERDRGSKLWIGAFTKVLGAPFPFFSVIYDAAVSPNLLSTLVTAAGTADSQGALLVQQPAISYWGSALQTDLNPFACQYIVLA